jgi:hypothetical protein
MDNNESHEEKAIRLLTRQLTDLQTVRGFNYKHADFKAWRDTTTNVLETFLGPESPYFKRFRDTRFYGSVSRIPYGVRVNPDYISPRDAHAFQEGCMTTDASLRAAIRHIEDFGVYVDQPKSVPSGRGRGKSGGVNFHAQTVTVGNLAIAADSAIQKIGQVGDTTGANLQEIANLLQESEDLTPRQVKEGLVGIKALAVEVEKPENKRNWKSILDYGQAVLAVADKAVDLGHKLAPYTPAIATLVDRAKHHLLG